MWASLDSLGHATGNGHGNGNGHGSSNGNGHAAEDVSSRKQDKGINLSLSLNMPKKVRAVGVGRDTERVCNYMGCLPQPELEHA